jgi:sterol desaturase/sphingolipid hydroxylase (fatty acid hydroxylase superfamily)
MLSMVVSTVDATEVRGGALACHARRFGRHVTPWAIAGLVAGFAAIRAVLGPVRWSDVAVVAAVVGLEPFIEWVVHAQVLHARPRQVLGRTIELSAAKGHRLHHEDPTNLQLVFVPPWVLVILAPALTLLFFGFLLPAHLAASALATGAVVLLAYEWTHYLIHTSYRPRTRAFRRQWRNHRLHHYRNEGYWFGVTTSVGDVVLRTGPPAASVPVSSAARTRAALRRGG